MLVTLTPPHFPTVLLRRLSQQGRSWPLSTQIPYAISLRHTDLRGGAPACPSWGSGVLSALTLGIATIFCWGLITFPHLFLCVMWVHVCAYLRVCVRVCVICNTHACTVTWGQQRASDSLELSWRLWSPFLPFLFLFLVLLGVILGLLFFKFSVLNLKISSTYIMLNFLFIITLTPLFYSPPSPTELSLLDKTLSPLLLPLPNRNNHKLWAPGHLSSAT